MAVIVHSNTMIVYYVQIHIYSNYTPTKQNRSSVANPTVGD